MPQLSLREHPQKCVPGASFPPWPACFPCKGHGTRTSANPRSSPLLQCFSCPAGRLLDCFWASTASPRLRLRPVTFSKGWGAKGQGCCPKRPPPHRAAGPRTRAFGPRRSQPPTRTHDGLQQRRARAVELGSQPCTIDSRGTSAAPQGTINGLCVPGAGDTPVRCVII